VTCSAIVRSIGPAGRAGSSTGGAASGIVRAGDPQQYDVDRQPATGDEARNIGNIGRHDIVGAADKKPPSGAGAAQGGDGDIRMTGGKAVAEGSAERTRGTVSNVPPEHRAAA
jgi:hypothetical protein